MRQYLLAVMFAASVVATASADGLAHESLRQPFWVHGRLSAWNGTPTFRIWVVGTNRILGIRAVEGSRDGLPRMPGALLKIIVSQQQVFGTNVYADFLPDPLADDEAGRMRPVAILSAKNIVVTYGGKLVSKQAQL